MIGRDNSLTERALLALLTSRPRLRWVGDLHDWRLIDPKRRRRLLLDGGSEIAGEWEGREDAMPESNLESNLIGEILILNVGRSIECKLNVTCVNVDFRKR